MEWKRIEAKWHEMARRLQQGHPSFQDTADAISRPERKLVQEPALRPADDVVVRAAI